MAGIGRFRSLLGLGPRAPVLGDLAFPSGTIEPLSVPHLFHVLTAGHFTAHELRKADGMECSFARMLAQTAPRKHYGIMSDIKTLLVPGVGMLGPEHCEEAFAFPVAAFDELFSKAGCQHISRPQWFTVQLLSGSALYLETLPAHLKHVPSLGRMLRTAQLVVDYHVKVDQRSARELESTAEECAARLRELFAVSADGSINFVIHREDAGVLLAHTGLPQSGIDPRARLVDLYGEVTLTLNQIRAEREWLGAGASYCRIGAPDVQRAEQRELEAIQAAATHTAQQVIGRGHYPALAIAGLLRTVSGEET